MKRMLIFWEIRDSSMSFTPILPKTLQHTIHKVYVQEHNSLYPKVWVTARIPIPKGVTPFARTAPSWKHAFPGTPGMHTIELMIHNQNTHHKLTNFT